MSLRESRGGSLRRTTLLEKLRKYGIGRGSETPVEDSQHES